MQGSLLLGPLLAGEPPVEAVNSASARSGAQTALTVASILCGLILIVFVQPHGELISSWHEVEWKHAALALTLLIGLLVICLVPALRDLFELQPLSRADLVLLAGVAAAWTVFVRSVWRWQLFERLLGSPSSPVQSVARHVR